MSDGFREALTTAKAEPRRPIHSFHRYFGKLIPAIPAAAIQTYTRPGDLVIDTFAGSGTTLVEARELGRRALGLDLNPLATFVSRVKTTPIATAELDAEYEAIVQRFQQRRRLGNADYPLPYVVNLHHWFRTEVLDDLLVLRAAISDVTTPQVRDFFMATFAAFNRGVSNADPQHVFPGYSKRMRALDEKGRNIDVMQSFHRAAKKRIKALSQIAPEAETADAHTASACTSTSFTSDAALAVINPPYISSIRYLETMKIEMGWLNFIESKTQYLSLDKTMMGTERFYKADLQHIPPVGINEVDEQIIRIREQSAKMAKTVSEYFQQVRPALEATCDSLRSGGHLVIKISDTNLRGEIIRTGSHMEALCHDFGMIAIHNFSDDYSPNSRSLLTARNTYSGLMTKDQILVMRKG